MDFNSFYKNIVETLFCIKKRSDYFGDGNFLRMFISSVSGKQSYGQNRGNSRKCLHIESVRDILKTLKEATAHKVVGQLLSSKSHPSLTKFRVVFAM